jgi:hypothetical protein
LNAALDVQISRRELPDRAVELLHRKSRCAHSVEEIVSRDLSWLGSLRRLVK